MAGANAWLAIDSIFDLQTSILPNFAHLTKSRPLAIVSRPSPYIHIQMAW